MHRKNSSRPTWVFMTLAVLTVVIPALAVEEFRLVGAVVLCLLVPGSGWAYRAGVGDVLDRIALAMALSMSATILVATAMAVTRSWSVAGGAAALTAIAVLGFVPIDRVRSPRGLHAECSDRTDPASDRRVTTLP
ncbi:hypothetical protein GQF49_14545 [Microbacter sp. ANSKLAB05]|nr:hypothetical protein [Microbacter sp. ANSKLAB05]